MTTDNNMATHGKGEGKKPNAIVRLWKWFWRPAPAIALGTLLIVGFVIGAAFIGVFNVALHATNTESFCTSCHEMNDNPLQELKETVHYNNRSGVRATCPDCHVPRDFIPLMAAKMMASNDVLQKILGTINTPEKFAEHRLRLATNQWRKMKSTDSRECRACHDAKQMDFLSQESRSARMHEEGFAEGKTCIDCHKGIAHKLPPNAEEAYQNLLKDMAAKK